MEETAKRILIACIIASIAGIASITLITALDYESNMETTNIAEISSKMAGENTVVCGYVKSKSISQSGTTFITLAEKNSKTQTIPLVFFKNEARQTGNISRGQSICARGIIQIYNGSAEIIERKIIQ